MKVTALAPWFGSARQNAKTIGALLGKHDWVGIPFCGGCCEIPHIQARSIAANDLHRHVITLAMTVAGEGYEKLRDLIDDVMVHPDFLDRARRDLETIEQGGSESRVDPYWAAAYFVNSWLSRSTNVGTDRELSVQIATRFTASGGSSVRRWRSAVESLPEWHKILRDRVEFTCLDWRVFLDKCHDRDGHALYVDPPWQDAGEEYKHKFTESDHRQLANWLREFEKTYVLIRHSDHPLYRELYPDWQWRELGGRNQGNRKISESVLTQRSFL